MGYGLGNLFCSLAKVVTPLVKRGAKGLGKIVATTGADLYERHVDNIVYFTSVIELGDLAWISYLVTILC